MVPRLFLSLCLVGSVAAFNPNDYGNDQLPLIPPQIPTDASQGSERDYDFVSYFLLFIFSSLTVSGTREADSTQSLRHIFHHGTYEYPRLHKRVDISPEETLFITSDEGRIPVAPPHLRASTQPVEIQRLVDRRPSVMEERLAAARKTGVVTSLGAQAWTIDEVAGPNVSDKNTVLNIAKMAANAYIMEPGTEKWEDVSGSFNHSQNFGWETDGLRGHIYADGKNSSIVVAMKGTSTALFDGEETTTNDKENDNLFFSCCCAQGGNYFWRQVCDCCSTTYTCNSTCLISALKEENRYYRAALDLYSNVTALYPESDVWLTGHSLGGSVSSLLGLTYGVPVVTYEAVPEALPAARLGLPIPPGGDPSAPQKREYTGAHHFGHTADPVYMGTCNGATSICTLGGYAMESSCHTGRRCVYDTVEDFGWRVGIGTHRILSVISDVLEKYDVVPSCEPDTVCLDCVNWKFFESNSSDPVTTTTSTATSLTTRTSTCKTPGWWGCRDKTTTTTPATATMTTTTTTTSTSTCQTPGWFGCNDPTTTTPAPSATAVPTSTPTTTSTSTCRHPGWFGGCNDATTTTSTPHQTSAPVTSGTCKTPGFFWGCWDEPTKPILSTSIPTSTQESTPTSTSGCSTPWFFWRCWGSTA